MPAEIEKRLKETSENCFVAYAKWEQNQNDQPFKTDLLEAIHELRKVASRLEIEVAASESRNSSRKRIEAPSHKNSRPKNGGDNDGGKPKRPRKKNDEGAAEE